MLSKVSILLLSINLLLNPTKELSFNEEDWTYDNQNDWDLHFKYCNGSHESPINIDTTKLRIDTKLKINFINYDQHFHRMTAQNNGHTVRVFIHPHQKNKIPYISGEAVNNENYILDSFHFHWGSNDFNGSEHSINNVKKSAELHLLHWNYKYGDVNNATNYKDGLYVIAIFIESKLITEYGVVRLIADNQVITPIIDVLAKIKNFGEHTRIRTPFNLKALLPKKHNLFYKYMGSLTTPPCSETAHFIIFPEPIYISSNQIRRLRDLKSEAHNGFTKPLSQNCREQKPLNDRIVWVSNPYSKINTDIE